MHPHSIARSTAPLELPRLRNASNQDNSFATARDLGSFSRPSSQFIIRARGSIGRSDRSDYAKFTLRPGFKASNAFGPLIVRGGSLRFSIFIEFEGQRQLALRRRATPGSNPLSAGPVPETPLAVTAYVVFDRPNGNVRYDYRRTLQP